MSKIIHIGQQPLTSNVCFHWRLFWAAARKPWMLQQRQQELGNLMPVSFTQCLKKKLDESRATLDLLTAQLFIPMEKGKTGRIHFFFIQRLFSHQRARPICFRALCGWKGSFPEQFPQAPRGTVAEIREWRIKKSSFSLLNRVTEKSSFLSHFSYSSGGEDGYVRVHVFDPSYFEVEFEY